MPRKPQGRGRRRTDIGPAILRLIRTGKQPIDIARTLGVSRQRVSQIMVAAGLDGRRDAAARHATQVARVRRAWQTCLDREAVARRLRLTTSQVDCALRVLRRQGVKLRPAVKPAPKTRAIEAARRNGLTAVEMIRRGIAARGTVYRVLRRFKPAGSAAGTVWTAEEDRLLERMSDAEVAAKTGRKESAVRWRCRRLRAARKVSGNSKA